jgi:CBS domain-containing protein
MAQQVHSCSPDDSLRTALRLMGDKKVRRLPVVADGKLVGIVSLGDIAREVLPNGSSIPACVALSHTLGSISGLRQATSSSAEAAE